MAKTTTPAPAPAEQAELETVNAVEVAPKQPTRNDLLASIKDAGYTGPTSFTATVLRDVQAWLDAGSPKDGNVPKGVLLAVYPDLKPAREAKAPRLSAHEKGYQAALSEVSDLGDDLVAIQQWVQANRNRVVAEA